MGPKRLVFEMDRRGLLAHFSAKAASRFQASFQALNDAIKEGAEHRQQDQPNQTSRACKGSTEADPSSINWSQASWADSPSSLCARLSGFA